VEGSGSPSFIEARGTTSSGLPSSGSRAMGEKSERVDCSGMKKIKDTEKRRLESGGGAIVHVPSCHNRFLSSSNTRGQGLENTLNFPSSLQQPE
jgi:hypothetical protein